MDNNKSIARNSIYLYVRMLITMSISFYTSRAILQILGIEDFGIYNLVAGVITSIAFISNTITSANARFLSYSIGLKKEDSIRKTFAICLTSSFIVAVLLLILCETIGLWWLNNKLNIPKGKLIVSQWVYHIAVINLFVLLLSTPFNAIIVAYEKMSVYAIVSIFNSALSLLIVFLLQQNPWNTNLLITYSFLLLLISIGIGIFYLSYTKRNFEEIKIKLSFEKGLKELFTYSSWDMYGNLSVTARTSGVAILQNIFFGVGLNAAIGIANQVQAIVTQFSSNILFASKPRVVKYYAAEEIQNMLLLIERTTKYTTLLLCMVMLPLIIEIDFVLKLWLGILPDYTSSLVTWFLLFVITANISQCLLMGIHATSKIKKSSLVNGSLYLLVLPIAYYGFKNGASPSLPYIANVVFVTLGGVLNAFYLKKEIPSFSIKKYYSSAVLPILLLATIDYAILLQVKKYINNPVSQFITVGFTSVFIITFVSWFFILEKESKNLIVTKLRKLWNRN